jgi:hypothetical protein
MTISTHQRSMSSGVVLRVPLGTQRNAYAQVIGPGLSATVIRVCPGIFDRLLSPTSVRHLVEQPSLFRSQFDVELAVRLHRMRIIGVFAIPEAEVEFPAFRIRGNEESGLPYQSDVIDLRTGDKISRDEWIVAHPGAEYNDLPIFDAPTVDTLYSMIEMQWIPRLASVNDLSGSDQAAVDLPNDEVAKTKLHTTHLAIFRSRVSAENSFDALLELGFSAAITQSDVDTEEWRIWVAQPGRPNSEVADTVARLVVQHGGIYDGHLIGSQE